MEAEVTVVEWLDDQREYPAGELAQRARFPEFEILELLHCGAIPRRPDQALSAARMAARLRRDFELDLQGVALALTLLQRIDELQTELTSLRAHSA